MKCEHVKNVLIDYLQDELDDSTRQGVSAHLDGCPSCQSEQRSLESIFNDVAGATPVEPPAEYWDTFSDKLNNRIKQEHKTDIKGDSSPNILEFPGNKTRRFVSPAFFAKAASLILVIGIVFFVSKGYQQQSLNIASLQQTLFDAQSPGSSPVLNNIGIRDSLVKLQASAYGFQSSGNTTNYFLLGTASSQLLAASYERNEDNFGADLNFLTAFSRSNNIPPLNVFIEKTGKYAPQLDWQIAYAQTYGYMEAMEQHLRSTSHDAYLLFYTGAILVNLELALQFNNSESFTTNADLGSLAAELSSLDIAPGVAKSIRKLQDLMVMPNSASLDTHAIKEEILNIRLLLGSIIG